MQVEVIFYDKNKGWGLCQDPEDGERYFLHITALSDPAEASLLCPRVRLECDSEVDPKGKGMRAVNARVIFKENEIVDDENPFAGMDNLIIYG